MEQLFFATVKDVKFTPKDGETKYVVQLLARLEPNDLTKLALFGDRILQVHLLVNEAADTKKRQGSMFDPEPKVDGSGIYLCANCGEVLDGFICDECGQRHREPVPQHAAEPEPAGPIHCTAMATHLIHYDAGDGVH